MLCYIVLYCAKAYEGNLDLRFAIVDLGQGRGLGAFLLLWFTAYGGQMSTKVDKKESRRGPQAGFYPQLRTLGFEVPTGAYGHLFGSECRVEFA